MQTSGVYKITSPSGKIYIGSSKNVDKRIKNYQNIKSVKRQTRVYNSFIKYGIQNHFFEIICYCEYHDLYKLENYYGLLFDVCGKNGLNCVLPGSGDIKGKVSLETIQKQKTSSGHNKGYKHTPEQNEANRQRNLGRKHTEETKRKVGLASKNRSFESKQKRLLNCPTRKEIIQYDLNMNFVAEHFSLRQLCRDLKGFYYNGVTNCLKNKTKKYKGFIWKYKENN